MSPFYHRHSFEQWQRSAINIFLNKHCAKSLIELEIIHSFGYNLVDWPIPFKNVENLKFSYGYLEVSNLPFNQLFPKIRRLDLSGLLVNPKIFEYTFEYLEHLDVEHWHPNHEFRVNAIETRLKLNPQLKNITLYQCGWDLLEIVNKNVPNLQRLEIFNFNNFSAPYLGDSIYFRNLKILTFQIANSCAVNIERIPLMFGQLEEITCFKLLNKWLDVMVKTKTFKKIKFGEVDEEQFMRIVEELPNLEEITTAIDTASTIDVVIDFMKIGKNLKRITFWQSDHQTRESIAKRLNGKWQIDTMN